MPMDRSGGPNASLRSPCNFLPGRYYSKYEPARWSDTDGDFADVYEWPWDGGKGELNGAVAIVVVPHSDIRVAAGQAVDVCVKGGVFDEFPAACATLTLR